MSSLQEEEEQLKARERQLRMSSQPLRQFSNPDAQTIEPGQLMPDVVSTTGNSDSNSSSAWGRPSTSTAASSHSNTNNVWGRRSETASTAATYSAHPVPSTTTKTFDISEEMVIEPGQAPVRVPAAGNKPSLDISEEMVVEPGQTPSRVPARASTTSSSTAPAVVVPRTSPRTRGEDERIKQQAQVGRVTAGVAASVTPGAVRAGPAYLDEDSITQPSSSTTEAASSSNQSALDTGKVPLVQIPSSAQSHGSRSTGSGPSYLGGSFTTEPSDVSSTEASVLDTGKVPLVPIPSSVSSMRSTPSIRPVTTSTPSITPVTTTDQDRLAAENRKMMQASSARIPSSTSSVRRVRGQGPSTRTSSAISNDTRTKRIDGDLIVSEVVRIGPTAIASQARSPPSQQQQQQQQPSDEQIKARSARTSSASHSQPSSNTVHRDSSVQPPEPAAPIGAYRVAQIDGQNSIQHQQPVILPEQPHIKEVDPIHQRLQSMRSPTETIQEEEEEVPRLPHPAPPAAASGSQSQPTAHRQSDAVEEVITAPVEVSAHFSIPGAGNDGGGGDGRADGEKGTTPWYKTTKFMVGSFILLLIVIGVGAGVGIASGSDSGDPAAPKPIPPTEVPTASPTPMFNQEEAAKAELARSYIVPKISSDEVLDDVTSPQSEALQWLVRDEGVTIAEDLPERDIENLENRYVLAVLYFALGGDRWFDDSGWLTSEDHCNWTDIACEGGTIVSWNTGGNFRDEDVGSNNIEGTLPREIQALTGLTELHLMENFIEDASSLEGMTQLTSLNLGSNPLDAPMEDLAFVSTLVNLRNLSLRKCGITGILGDTISGLTNLRDLYLDRNELAGVITTEFSALSELRGLFLESNFLEGSLEDAVEGLTKLDFLGVANNNFSGSLGSNFSRLTLLRNLQATSNRLTGSIPSEIGTFSRLIQALFDRNSDITGTLPTEVGRLTNLQDFRVSQTNVEGAIPTQLWTLPKLNELRLKNTLLTGTVPEDTCSTIPFIEVDCAFVSCSCASCFCR